MPRTIANPSPEASRAAAHSAPPASPYNPGLPLRPKQPLRRAMREYEIGAADVTAILEARCLVAVETAAARERPQFTLLPAYSPEFGGTGLDCTRPAPASSPTRGRES